MGIRTLLGCICSLLAVPLAAVPLDFNGVLIEEHLETRPTDDSESTILAEEAVTLDLDTLTGEFGAFEKTNVVRQFTYTDANVAGVTLTPSTSSGVDDCDSAPPCPEPLVLSQNYLAIGNDIGAGKGILAPNNEFYATIGLHTERISLTSTADIGFEVLLAKPTSLVPADLNGSYSIAVFSSEAESFSNGFSDEFIGAAEFSVTFDGNGTCSGAAERSNGSFQSSNWPDLSSRQNIRAARESLVTMITCSYTVDAAAGTTDVTFQLPDEGDVDTTNVTLFVSSEYRYLAGRLSETVISGTETSVEQTLIVGARRATSASNAGLQAVYLLSTTGKRFESSAPDGTDTSFVSRAAVDLSGDTPDTNGYSSCSILGDASFGLTRSLGGSVPMDVSRSVEFSTDVGPTYTQCRYRANSGGTLDLEFSTDGSNWDATAFIIADDNNTLISAQATTTDDPLPANAEQTLTNPALAVAQLTLMQRYDGNASDAAVADFVAALVPPVDPNVVLVSSVLPGSRSVAVGATATAFATVINAGSVDGINCDIQFRDPLPVDFFYQQTDPATNAAIGEQNDVVNIAAGAVQTFIFGITPNAEITSVDINLVYTCLNSDQATSIVGLNTLLLSASNVATPDIVALGATVSNDGIAHLDGVSRAGFFALASVNVGAGADLTVEVDTGDATLPLTTSICQTDPLTSVCINPTTAANAPVSLTIGQDATPTFAVFISASEDIALDAAAKRIFVRFRDNTGTVRGATSVAVQTDSP